MKFDRPIAISFAASCGLHGSTIMVLALCVLPDLMKPAMPATPRLDVVRVRVDIVTEISIDDTTPTVEAETIVADDEPLADLAQDVAPTEPSEPAPVPPRPATAQSALAPTIPATEPTIGAATTATEPQPPETTKLSQGRDIERVIHIEPRNMTVDEFDELLEAWEVAICWRDWSNTWHHPAGARHDDDHSTTAAFRISVTYDFPKRESYVTDLLARRGVHHFRSFSLIGSARGRRLIQEIEDDRPERTKFDYVLTRSAIRLRD